MYVPYVNHLSSHPCKFYWTFWDFSLGNSPSHSLGTCTFFLPGHPSTPHYLHVLPFQAVLAGLLRDFEAADLATAAEHN
jgi:hypothetical protein